MMKAISWPTNTMYKTCHNSLVVSLLEHHYTLWCCWFDSSHDLTAKHTNCILHFLRQVRILSERFAYLFPFLFAAPYRNSSLQISRDMFSRDPLGAIIIRYGVKKNQSRMIGELIKKCTYRNFWRIIRPQSSMYQSLYFPTSFIQSLLHFCHELF